MVAAWPAALIWDIWLPVSDAPTASMTSAVGTWARKRSLIVELSGAPPEMTMSSEERS